MKITNEHATILREHIKRVDANNPGALSRYLSAGLSEKRYRWDCFWAASAASSEFKQTIDAIYRYANDDHIDTILRQITGTK